VFVGTKDVSSFPTDPSIQREQDEKERRDNLRQYRDHQIAAFFSSIVPRLLISLVGSGLIAFAAIFVRDLVVPFWKQWFPGNERLYFSLAGGLLAFFCLNALLELYQGESFDGKVQRRFLILLQGLILASLATAAIYLAIVGAALG